MRWDIYCRVIDNYGDIGTCWRLAAELAARGEFVRLWTDDAGALAWMAPHGAPGVTVHAWPDNRAAHIDRIDCGDVVIEAFGCELPPGVIESIGQRRPVWINLEYLSAEPYVERSHALPSPQAGGVTKWFFYPGFTAQTGGLIRERGLIERRNAFVATPGRERRVSLYCYPGAPVQRLVESLAGRPTVLLCPPGIQAHGSADVRIERLPFLSQRGFDELLWSCDLNVVRGEDSLVRALWAGAPLLWQIYPQADGAHVAKLHAFLDRLGADDRTRRAFCIWNGLEDGPPPWPARPDALRSALLAQDDLVSRLQAFVAAKH